MSEETKALLSIFRITSRNTGQEHFAVAMNAQDACSSLGLLLDDCHVLRVDARKHRRPDGVIDLMLKIPCRVCTYQYAACLKPPADPCPARGTSPDLQKWLLQVTKAHLCKHVGVAICKKDFEDGEMWLTVDEATYYIASQGL